MLNGDNTTFKTINQLEDNTFHFLQGNGHIVTLFSMNLVNFPQPIENIQWGRSYGSPGTEVLYLKNVNFINNSRVNILPGFAIHACTIIGENCSFIDDYPDYSAKYKLSRSQLNEYNAFPINLVSGYLHLVNSSFIRHGEKMQDMCYWLWGEYRQNDGWNKTETDNLTEWVWKSYSRDFLNNINVSASEMYNNMLPTYTSTNDEISELGYLYDYWGIPKPTNNLLENFTKNIVKNLKVNSESAVKTATIGMAVVPEEIWKHICHYGTPFSERFKNVTIA